LPAANIERYRRDVAKNVPGKALHVAYTRISIAESEDRSLGAQDRTLRALAAAHEHDLSAVYTDNGVSGAREDRPGLDALLTEVRAGRIKSVYVAKLDRLSRSLVHLLTVVQLFEKHKVVLISASESIDTSTPVGRMMLSLLGTFAEFERERIAERTRDASDDRRRAGRVYGPNTPYGYIVVGDRIVADPIEQVVVTQIQTLRTFGTSYARIAAMLNAQGTTTKKGRQWEASIVRSVLSSKATTRAA
jgi:site-specific DNA recombinase